MKCNWICSRCPYWHECPEYKPKTEEQMTDKIQMTEEQFAELYTFFHATNFSESYIKTIEGTAIQRHFI